MMLIDGPGIDGPKDPGREDIRLTRAGTRGCRLGATCAKTSGGFDEDPAFFGSDRPRRHPGPDRIRPAVRAVDGVIDDLGYAFDNTKPATARSSRRGWTSPGSDHRKIFICRTERGSTVSSQPRAGRGHRHWQRVPPRRRRQQRDAGQHNELHRSAALARSSKGDTATSPPGESDDRPAVLKGRVA
jgi:hypothetical protein